MPDKDLIWSSPKLGTSTYMWWDGDHMVLETRQNIGPIIEANKAEFNEAGSSPRFGEMKRVASIPLNEMIKLIQDGILSERWAVIDERRFREWINDPSNRFFRTFPGKV